MNSKWKRKGESKIVAIRQGTEGRRVTGLQFAERRESVMRCNSGRFEERGHLGLKLPCHYQLTEGSEEMDYPLLSSLNVLTSVTLSTFWAAERSTGPVERDKIHVSV
jgi:hypothetical protein